MNVYRMRSHRCIEKNANLIPRQQALRSNYISYRGEKSYFTKVWCSTLIHLELMTHKNKLLAVYLKYLYLHNVIRFLRLKNDIKVTNRNKISCVSYSFQKQYIILVINEKLRFPSKLDFLGFFFFFSLSNIVYVFRHVILLANGIKIFGEALTCYT